MRVRLSPSHKPIRPPVSTACCESVARWFAVRIALIWSLNPIRESNDEHNTHHQEMDLRSLCAEIR